MEVRSDNLDIQVNMLKGQTPNEQVFVASEDFAIASEVVIDRPDFIEVEKRTVIKRNCIINEKYVINKSSGTAIPVDQGQHTLPIDASLVGCEFSFPDSQGSGVMEIASQGSLESKMEICSQESLMEYSSQETDIPTESVNATVSSNEATCDDKFAKESQSSSVHPDLPIIEENCYAEVSSTSDKPPVAQGEFPEQAYCDSYKEGGISRIFQEYGDENDLENEAEFREVEQSIAKFNDLKRRSSTGRLLLAREKSVAAREEACVSREKALKKREAAIANQKEILKECVDDVIPLPKRLKLMNVFEYM